MKITVVGLIAMVGTIVLLVFVMYHVGSELDRTQRKNNEPPNNLL